jgi:hypothetical protein
MRDDLGLLRRFAQDGQKKAGQAHGFLARFEDDGSEKADRP